MKRFIICLICIFIVVFSTYVIQNKDTPCTTFSPPNEMPIISTEVTVDPVEAVWKQYAALYNTDSVFSDLYMKDKYLLVGEENIVQLISIAGYDAVVVLNRASIERIERTKFGGFSKIVVFDRTNQSVEIMITTEEEPLILKLLQ